MIHPQEERRTSYRLDMGPEWPVQIQLAFANGSSFEADLQTLSAGGFSCTGLGDVDFREGIRAKFSFSLALEDDYVIKSYARLVSAEENRGKSLYRFRFDTAFPEAACDIIHRFILKKQLEQIRETQGRRLS